MNPWLRLIAVAALGLLLLLVAPRLRQMLRHPQNLGPYLLSLWSILFLT